MQMDPTEVLIRETRAAGPTSRSRDNAIRIVVVVPADRKADFRWSDLTLTLIC
jgi:hypothetical protein